MKRLERLMSLVAVCLALSSVAFPQASSTSLRGTVTDPSGSAVPSATVVIDNAESRIARPATAGEGVEDRFLSLPPGTYTLTVTSAGFTRYQQTGIQLLVNTPVTANVQLKVGGTNESVTVTGEAPVLNEVDASLGNSFDQTQVREIPIEGRNVAELLTLQRGGGEPGNRPHIER